MKQEDKIVVSIILGAFIIGGFILIGFFLNNSGGIGKVIDGDGEEDNNNPVASNPPTEEFAEVIKVVDGDTIRIDNGESVRLICIDTPERGEEGYKEAALYLEKLILNQRVKLTGDVSNRDKYSRLLRYIYTEKGDFVNEIMVREGYAEAYPYNPDTRLCPQIIEAEKLAREEKLGVWAEEEEEKKPDIPEESFEYDCSSNIYNCADFTSQKDAQDIFELCGGIDNDVHRLDNDGDGIVCETLR